MTLLLLRCLKGTTTEEKGKLIIFPQSPHCHGNLVSISNTHLKKWPLSPHRGTEQILKSPLWSFPSRHALANPLLFLFNPTQLPVPPITKPPPGFGFPQHLPSDPCLRLPVVHEAEAEPLKHCLVTLLCYLGSQRLPGIFRVRINS